MESRSKPHCPHAEEEFRKLINTADELGVNRQQLNRMLTLTGDLGAHRVCSLMLSHPERVQLMRLNVDLHLSS